MNHIFLGINVAELILYIDWRATNKKNRLVISPNFGGLAEGLEGPVLGLTESYKRIFVFFFQQLQCP